MWIDELFVGVSDNYFGKGKSEPSYTTFSQVEFYALVSAEGSSYFDNTFISREEKEFDAFDATISDSRGE